MAPCSAAVAHPAMGNPATSSPSSSASPACCPSPALEIDIVLVEIDELRVHAPDGPWRRRGWTVVERRLIEVLTTVPIRSLTDLASLLPPELPDPFTTAELATR